jgi:hypothetical protein
MKRLSTAALLALLVFVMAAQSASATTYWYAGNFRTSAYGVKADISTPSSAPNLGNSPIEASWVSTPPPYWIQTGWAYGSGYSYAKPFTEYMLSGGVHNWTAHGSQSWGTSKNYKLDYSPDSWSAYIDGTWKVTLAYSAVPNAPIDVQAYSEVQDDSTATMYNLFSSVMWKNSGGSWNYFDQNNNGLIPPTGNPYNVGSGYSTYLTWGPD